MYPATTEIYTLSLHDPLPISVAAERRRRHAACTELRCAVGGRTGFNRRCLMEARITAQSQSLPRSEEHTSELQSLRHLVCRLLLEKKNKARLKHDIQVISSIL